MSKPTNDPIILTKLYIGEMGHIPKRYRMPITLELLRAKFPYGYHCEEMVACIGIECPKYPRKP